MPSRRGPEELGLGPGGGLLPGSGIGIGARGGVRWAGGRPKPVLEKVSKEDADKAKEAIEAAGGTVELS